MMSTFFINSIGIKPKHTVTEKHFVVCAKQRYSGFIL